MDQDIVVQLAAFSSLVGRLAHQMEEMKIQTAETATVVSTITGSTLLEPKMVPLELKAPMGRDRDTEAGTERTTSPSMGVKPSRLPPQPLFNGKEFNVFLERWQRWTHLAGIDSLDEQAQRVWFLGAMEETVLTVVEAVFKKTTGVTELFIETGKVFPIYVSDFTLRGEIGAIPQLSWPPSMVDI